jgi:hypothetical protein
LAKAFLIDEGIVREFSLEETSHDLIADLPEFFNQIEPQAKQCELKDAVPQVNRRS